MADLDDLLNEEEVPEGNLEDEEWEEAEEGELVDDDDFDLEEEAEEAEEADDDDFDFDLPDEDEETNTEQEAAPLNTKKKASKKKASKKKASKKTAAKAAEEPKPVRKKKAARKPAPAPEPEAEAPAPTPTKKKRAKKKVARKARVDGNDPVASLTAELQGITADIGEKHEIAQLKADLRAAKQMSTKLHKFAEKATKAAEAQDAKVESLNARLTELTSAGDDSDEE